MKHSGQEFSETQQFRQWWLWTLLILSQAFVIYGTLRQIRWHFHFGNYPASNNEMIVMTAVMLLVNLLFFYMRLDTRINDAGVEVRFFPFHWTFRKYPWSDIQSAQVRTYSPIMEYGGWGIRMGMTGSGKAFSVSGSTGLQLIFRNGKKLLIGTRQGDKMTSFLKTIH